MDYYFLADTETNGLEGDRYFAMLSVAYTILNENMKPIDSGYYLLWRDDIKEAAWDKTAQQFHGITRESSVENGTHPSIAASQLLIKMSRCKYIVAHNIGHDIAAFEELFSLTNINSGLIPEGLSHIDTGKISKLALKLRKWNLRSTWEYLFPASAWPYQHHNAIDDTMALLDILIEFKKRNIWSPG